MSQAMSFSERAFYLTPRNKSYAHLVGVRHTTIHISRATYFLLVGMCLDLQPTTWQDFFRIIEVTLVFGICIGVLLGWSRGKQDFMSNCIRANEQSSSLHELLQREWRLIAQWNLIAALPCAVLALVIFLFKHNWNLARVRD